MKSKVYKIHCQKVEQLGVDGVVVAGLRMCSTLGFTHSTCVTPGYKMSDHFLRFVTSHGLLLPRGWLAFLPCRCLVAHARCGAYSHLE